MSTYVHTEVGKYGLLALFVSFCSSADGVDSSSNPSNLYSRHAGIEPSGYIKFWEVLEGLHNWRLLKKGSAP
jgi:hypothetical protein